MDKGGKIEPGFIAFSQSSYNVHAGTKEELLRRPQAVTLLRAGAFGAVALLGSREAPGTICEWEKAGDLLAQAAGNAAAGSDRSFCRVSGVA